MSYRSPDFQQHRGLVLARGGMVASAHPLASATGLRVLREGGNAADAAIATAAVCAVTLAGRCGLGGDMFCLYYDAATRRVTGFNGSGAAPGGASIAAMKERDLEHMPETGALSVTVPGAVHGYSELHRRFGSRPWQSLFEDAIHYAEEGHPVSEDVDHMIASIASRSPEAAWSNVFTPGGRAPEIGEILKQTDLAWSLRQVAEGGRDAFYQGEVGQRIVAALQARGSLMTEADLRAHTTEVYSPITTTYRGLTVHETQPPSQGFIVLEMLNLLEPEDLQALGFGSAQAIHLMVEAKKLAFADRLAYMGDPRYVDAPTAELISKEHAARRREAIDRKKARVEAPSGGLAATPADTTYFCVVDGQGNAVSFIHTLFATMGSRVLADNTGIVLTNRGSAFSLDEKHPNRLEPGKRTMHTLNCYLVTEGDELVLVGGTPGGDSQPQWNVQTLTNIFDFGMNVQQAADAPRWNSSPGTQPTSWDNAYALEIEEGFPSRTYSALERLGHQVRRVPSRALGGHVQLIRRDPATGVLSGGSDPHGDGAAMGF